MNQNIKVGKWDGSVDFDWDFISLYRWRPDLAEHTYECIQIVGHPDEENSVLFMHEFVYLDQYFDDHVPCPVHGCEEEILIHILAGWGFESVEEFFLNDFDDDGWDARAGDSHWASLAALICGSYYLDAVKLRPQEACEKTRDITGLECSVKDFTDLGESGFDRIRAMRSKMDMSQSEMANYFGIPVRTLQGWEAGKIRGPKKYVADMMERLIALRAFEEKG